MEKLIVSSSAFENNKLIPSRYACDDENINPPLAVAGIPEGTKSLVLIVEDPDAAVGLWIHWVVWNIPLVETIRENSVPGVQGMTTSRKRSYSGPCPPSGTHRYFFRVFALDAKLDLRDNSEKKDVEKAMQNHVLAKGELVGLYHRSRIGFSCEKL